VIARVQGVAVRRGCQLVGHGDLAVASESRSSPLPGIKSGIFCIHAWSRRCAQPRAQTRPGELSPGDLIDAKTALSWAW